MRKPVVIFDMDGVIINSMPVHYKALKKMFSEIGINDYTFKELLENDVTIGAMNLVPRVLKSRHKKANVRALLKRKSRFMEYRKIKLNPGVRTLLDKLKKEKYTVVLASNGTRGFVNIMLRQHRLRKYFSKILTGEDIRHHKPNPEIYRKMAKLLKVRPSECIVIEDSRDGVAAGKRAGMTVIGNSVKLEHQDLRRADVIVSSMKRITPDFIEKYYRKPVR